MPIPPPNLLLQLDGLSHIVSSARLGVAVDFDGTISKIVAEPDAAAIWPESATALSHLASRLPLVSVVTGRAVSDVVERVGLDKIVYVGNHGAEYFFDGNLDVVQGSNEGRDALLAAFGYLRARAGSAGVIWEDKGISASVHYRTARDGEAARTALAAALASAPGVDRLEVFWGKMLLELRAPTGLTKGYALRRLVRDWDLDAIVFIGDDTTDGDALSALKEMVSEGQVSGVGVAVRAEDTPEALLAAADYTLDGVSEVGAFLTWLHGAVP